MPVQSPVDVVNIALARLFLEPVVSLDDEVGRSKRIRPFWDIALRTFLGESEWSFARTTRELAELRLKEDAARPFRHAYAIPDDCIKVTAVRSWQRGDLRYIPPEHNYRIAIPEGATRSAVLADASNVTIEYITERANLSAFPPDAIDALACRVGAEYALARQDMSGRAQQLLQFYELALAKAKKNDAKKEPPKRLSDDSFYAQARKGVTHCGR